MPSIIKGTEYACQAFLAKNPKTDNMFEVVTVEIKKIEYGGWPNCYLASNGDVELVVTGDMGPRIIRFGFVGGKNLFKEHAEQMGKSGESRWVARGGHRLWAAPEEARTYAPDNVPVRIEIQGEVLEAEEPVEPTTGLQKRISVRLAAHGTKVEVGHRITNRGADPTQLAAWAITQMAPDGATIHTFPPRGPHPEHLKPTNPLVMWAYSDLSDPRWHFTERHLVLRQDPASKSPQKLGSFNQDTWAGYLLGDELFMKHSSAPGSPSEYPDFGCSFETFTNSAMLEIETLGLLRTLQPGEYVEHTEEWWLKRSVHLENWTDEEMDAAMAVPREA